MAATLFQIRRGSGSISLVDGEIFLHKGSGSLQIGMGGANLITLAKVDSINSGSFSLIGDITASNAYFSGDVAISGNLFLGNNTGDNISVPGVFTTNLVPGTNGTLDLGTTGAKWRTLWVNSVSASFTGSVDGVDITVLNQRVTSLETESSSLESRAISLATITGSLINSASSFESRNVSLATITGSLISTASVDTISIANLNSYTSSLKTAIELTGSSVTILGNLVVKGTQTTLDSTTIQLGDNIIELNGSSNTNGGLLVKDPTGGSTISGSLLWDTTNDYWKGGKLENESKILLAGGDNVFTSSLQLTELNSTTASLNSTTASLNLFSASVTSSLTSIYQTTASLNVATASLQTFSSSTLSRLTALETETGSLEGRANDLAIITGSLIQTASLNTIAVFNLNTETASLENRATTLAQVTGSIHQFTSSLNTYTGATEIRLDDLEYTASISVGAGLAASFDRINAFTASADERIAALELYSASYAQYFTYSGSQFHIDFNV